MQAGAVHQLARAPLALRRERAHALASAPRETEVEEPTAAQLDKPVALPGETDQREARTSGAKTAADVQTDDQSFELEDAQWAEVDLVLPNGIPLDDDLALVSFSSEGDEEMDRWTMSSLASEVDLTNGFVEEVDADWARREVSGSGRVRIPFHPDSKEGALLLVSRYAYAPVQKVDLSSDEPVLVEAELGGWVTGRVVLPTGVEDRELEIDDFDVEFQGRGEGGLFGGRNDSREVVLRDDWTYELRALSAGQRYFVTVEADKLVNFVELRFEVQPGEHRVYDIPLEAGAVLSGIVVDARGNGVGDADVAMEPSEGGLLAMRGNEAETETDDDGTFVLYGITPGKSELSVYADGFLELEEEELELRDGQHLADYRIVLDEGNTIRGIVLWPDGSPAESARVAAVLRQEQGWRNEVSDTRAQEDGSFVLGGLEDGPYEVVARLAPDEGEPEAGVADAALRLDSWEGLDFSTSDGDAAEWRARAKDVVPNTNGLELVLEEPLTFQGIVVDDAGGPVRAFAIEAKASGSTRWSGGIDSSFESEDGSFLFSGVYDGDWTISAQAEGYSQGEDHEVAIQVPYAGEPVRLVLQRAITVRGVVLDPSGRPVAKAEVSATAGDSGDWSRWSEGQSTETDEEGFFEFESLPPTGLQLSADAEDWAPSEPQPILAPPGETLADLVVQLRVGATITGEVYDANGEPDAGVTVAAGQNQFGMFGMGGDEGVQTDSAGTFRIEHVAPGKVTVTAMPNEDQLLDELENGDGDEQAMMMNVFGQMRMESVEVADGEEVHVVLGAKTKDPVRVTGRVTESGEPIADATVLVIEEGGSFMQGMKMGKTDASGAYEVTVDRPGAFVFNVSSEGFGSQQVPFFVDVPEAETYDLDLELPLGRISGRVVGLDRAPLEGVSVQLVQDGGVMGIFDFDQSRNRVTGSDGAFSFEHVRPGNYAIHAGGGSMNFVVDTSQHYGAEVYEGIELVENGVVDDVEIRLSRAGRLVGRVVDGGGTPVSGAAVFVRNESGNVISNVSTTMTNGTGEFVYEGVPSEDVTVFARKEGLTSVEVGPVNVGEGADTEVSLVLEEGVMFVVTLESDGEPIRARIEVLDEEGRQVNGLFSMESIQAMLTEGVDSKERRIGPVPPGKYKLIAVSPDGKETKKTVTVRSGQDERRVRLRLR